MCSYKRFPLKGRPFDSWGAMGFCKKKIAQQIMENK